MDFQQAIHDTVTSIMCNMQENRKKVVELNYEWRACRNCGWQILSRYEEPMCTPCLEYQHGWN